MKVLPSDEELLAILYRHLAAAIYNKRKVRARSLRKDIAYLKLLIKLDKNGQLKKSKDN